MKKYLMMLTMLAFAASVGAVSVNQKAPDFTLPTTDGSSVTLSQAKGNVVFVNFWATWCPPCNQEFPELMKLADAYKEKGVRVLAISIDIKRDKVDAFVAKNKAAASAIQVLLDPKSTVVSAYDVPAMPTSFVIDRAGVVRFVHEGYDGKDAAVWRKEIDTLLGEAAK